MRRSRRRSRDRGLDQFGDLLFYHWAPRPKRVDTGQISPSSRLPHNAVEYFVSYYDYYQPEAYIPQTDTYIEKARSGSRRRVDVPRQSRIHVHDDGRPAGLVP
jgi:hypothetical protein